MVRSDENGEIDIGNLLVSVQSRIRNPIPGTKAHPLDEPYGGAESRIFRVFHT
jgi:hypothetical protein